MNITDIKDFDQLLSMVREDTGLIEKLSDEQVTMLRTKINPYGRTVEGSGKLTCLSIINMEEQYMRKFLMTSLIGFLYRKCDEHGLDDGEPPMYMDDHKSFLVKYNKAVDEAKESYLYLQSRDGKNNTTPELKARHLKETRIFQKGESMKKRIIIHQFLDDNFTFNPDIHVRSAYSSNPLDTERNIISNSNSTASNSTTSNSTSHIPPADIFHRWQYYTDTNYEEIRSSVRDLYCEKPDIEFAINPYDQFENKEDSDKFIQKHKNEVIADILTLTNGKWNLCGSFKKNRERINFYNEKTAVIEEIFKQVEQDKKLGADLMRKRVVRKKKQNVLECGKEPEEFKQYRKENPSGFETYGAEDMSKHKEQNNITSNNISNECPYDAVQVDVFDFSQGGTTVTKSEFFTEADAPKKINQ